MLSAPSNWHDPALRPRNHSSAMNRPGAVPQSLRGLPTGFGSQQQQPQQPGRAVSNRLQNGKLAGNGSGWAFGAGIPMSSGGLPNPSRQLGGNVSFAQSLSGSQPATPLDLAEFPSLSSNSQLPNQSQSTMWSSSGSRNLGGPAGLQRNQPTPLSSQHQGQHHGQQDDLFTATSRLPTNQSSFRFGNQQSIAQASQSQSGGVEEFPPLNRNANGDVGRDRGGPSLMSSLGFSTQGGSSAVASVQQATRAGNGLLNVLSANTRAAEARSPVGTRPLETRGVIGEDESRQQKSGVSTQTSPLDSSDSRHHPGAIGNNAPVGKAKEDEGEQSPPVQDPLAAMPDDDKWGVKGLRYLMTNSSDYNALVCGIDYTSLGLDLRAPEMISEQIYSAFDPALPRPAIPKFKLPECYRVTNVQPLENKIQGFNEETLMWMFYSCPNDIKQHLAALELHNRNWRWHKKHQVWLTKDEHMMPQVISPSHERGYYLVWNTTSWGKERRELELDYADLDTSPMNLGLAG